MAQWSANGSDANGSPNWAHAQLKIGSNSTIRQVLYNNTVANTHVPEKVVGVCAANATEVAIHKEISHTGFHLRTVGTGGRAGRVHYECLVAGGVTGDNVGDNSFLPAPAPNVVIDLQPYPPSGNNGNSNRTFMVVAHVVPRTLSVNAYQWQFLNSTAQFENVAAANSTQQAGTTAFFLIPNTAAVDGNTYRCNVSVNSTVFAVTTNVVVT
jgi:hypothetical protein